MKTSGLILGWAYQIRYIDIFSYHYRVKKMRRLSIFRYVFFRRLIGAKTQLGTEIPGMSRKNTSYVLWAYFSSTEGTSDLSFNLRKSPIKTPQICFK